MCKVINDKENMTRILLVDDEKDTEYAFALILKAEGYIVDAYDDPVKALLAFKQQNQTQTLVVVKESLLQVLSQPATVTSTANDEVKKFLMSYAMVLVLIL